MAVTLRGRRTRYDNIAVGSAITSKERTISGAAQPVEIHGGGFMTSTSTGDVWHNNLKVGSSVTDQVSPNTVPENVQVIAAAVADENVKVGG